jgi:DNA-binding NarL/FixJ family response regulator
MIRLAEGWNSPSPTYDIATLALSPTPFRRIDMTGKKRVLIADDHLLFRESLKQLLAGTEEMSVVDEAENGLEVLRKVQENDYDLILLDISMPGKSGLDILPDIKRMKPEVPVLILSMHPEAQYAPRAFKSGASGYLTKGAPFKEIIEAMRIVMQDKHDIDSSLTESKEKGLAKYLPTPGTEFT